MATIEERSVKNNNLNTIKITINLYDINSADDIPELFNKVTHECTHGLDMYILSYNQYDKNKKSKVFIDKEKDGNIFDVYYKDEDWLFQFMYYMDPIELKILSSGLSKYLLKISRPPLNDKTGVYMKMNNQLRNDLLKYKSPREKVLAILDRQDIQNIVHLDVLRAMKDDFVLLNISEKIPNQLDVDYDPTTDYEYLMSNYPKYRALIRILIVGYYLVNHNFFSLTELIQNSALKFLNNKQTVYKLIKNIKDISERDGFDKILKAITVKVNDLFMNYQEMIYNKALYAVQVFGL